MSKTVCRACLCSNSRMYDLRNTPLQGIFEKITGAELVSGDGRSLVCYVCCARLQSCVRFQQMVTRAEREYKRMLVMDVKWSESRCMSGYSSTPVDRLSLPDASPPPAAHPAPRAPRVKLEPPDVEVKQELPDVKIEDVSSEVDYTMIPEELMISALPSQQSLGPERALHHCRYCLKELHSQEQLTTHERAHHVETCDICDATYPASKRDNHTRKHTKPYECPRCHKSFSELSSLRKHVASHSAARPFVCGTCGKGFTHKSYLVVHIRSHTGEKPYACSLCARSFTQVAHLVSHRRTHEPRGARYECDACAASFTLRSSLLKHVRSHARLKPHACRVCGRTFARLDTLACHARRHTGERPYACSACGAAYAAKANYRKHLKTHHNDSHTQ